MHQKKKHLPGYLLHKPSSQAYVRINGRHCYLGKYDSAESRKKYNLIIADYMDGVPLDKEILKKESPPLSVGELAEQYLISEEERFGCKHKQTYATKYAMLALTEKHAGLNAIEFGPKALKRIRSMLVDQQYAHSEVNARVNKIRSAFKWAVSEELIPESVWGALKSLPPLRRGEARINTPRVAACPEAVEITIKKLHDMGNSGAAHLIQFLRWTGCRPSEGCGLTIGSLELDNSPAIVRLREHKTAQLNGERIIPLNEMAVEAIQGALLGNSKIGPEEPVFKSTRGEQFLSNGLYQAVRRTCKQFGIEPWAPYQLRHLVATEIINASGNEASAAALLGHSARSTVIKRYSTNRLELASNASKILVGAIS